MEQWSKMIEFLKPSNVTCEGGMGGLEVFMAKILHQLRNDSMTKLQLESTSSSSTSHLSREAFCRLLEQAAKLSTPSLAELEFRYLEIDHQLANQIMNMIQTKVFFQITFVRCSGPYFEFLITKLAHENILQQHCQRLFLNHNRLSLAAYAALGKAFTSSSTTCGSPSGSQTQQHPQSLNLKGLSLDSKKARALFLEGMQNTTALTELKLNFCRFQDNNSVQALAHCLKFNRIWIWVPAIWQMIKYFA